MVGDAVAQTYSTHTEVLGPFVGADAPLHPDNLEPRRIRFYGTDLGWTYEHQGQLQILFGDTMANEQGDPIDAASGQRLEDSFGSIDLARWNDPAKFAPGQLPLVRLGQVPGSAEAAAIDPGHAMEGFKTPVAGFSNGQREYGLFFTYKPQACRQDADCSGGVQCDTGLGFIGTPWDSDEGITFACVDGSVPQCQPQSLPAAEGDTPESGFCVDRGSSAWADTAIGRSSGTTVKLLVGIRDTDDPARYHVFQEWQTNRFMNPAVRTVQAFTPGVGDHDFKPASSPGGASRVFVWGRPGFIGVGTAGRDLELYFAWTDLPRGNEQSWSPHYFAGLDEQGQPRFSERETEAAAIDLDSSQPGVQAEEIHDIVDQVSIAWVEPLRKWVMIYGGGMVNLPIEPMLPTCGVLELFTGSECTQVRIGNGAFRMRTADLPWGPWSPPRDLIEAGDPYGPPVGQYGVGGMLRHPACTEPGCAPHTAARDINPKEYGFFYSANIIEQWTRPAPGGGADLVWNASTWDPYRVILLRTRIQP